MHKTNRFGYHIKGIATAKLIFSSSSFYYLHQKFLKKKARYNNPFGLACFFIFPVFLLPKIVSHLLDYRAKSLYNI